MCKLKMIYSRILCKDSKFPVPCVDQCISHCEELDTIINSDYSRNLSCNNSIECRSCCIIADAADMIFSGVHYNDNFDPVWHLSLNGNDYDSKYCKLIHLSVDGDIIYSFDRDDIRLWHDNNLDICLHMRDLKKTNNYHGSKWIEEYCSMYDVNLPFSEDMLNKFLSHEMPGWDDKPEGSNPFSTNRMY